MRRWVMVSRSTECPICGKYIYFGNEREVKCSNCGTIVSNPAYTKVGTKQAETQLAFIERRKRYYEKYEPIRQAIIRIVREKKIATPSTIFKELQKQGINITKQELYVALYYLRHKGILLYGYTLNDLIKKCP